MRLSQVNLCHVSECAGDGNHAARASAANSITGERIVTILSNRINVRCLIKGELLYRLRHTTGLYTLALVPGQADLVLTGDYRGSVHLWDIDKGVRVRSMVTVNSDEHTTVVGPIVATPTQLACLYGQRYDYKQLIIINFDV